MTICCIVAHPDDEVLGCGATLARAAAEGHEVHVVIMGVRHLLAHAQEAAHLLGVESVTVHDLPDQRFDTLPFLEIAQMIEHDLQFLRPAVIYTHHRHDLNLDHALVSRAVLTATRPKPEYSVKEVRMCEVPSSTEWGFNYRFTPNVFVDVEQTFDLKLQAMETCYASEMAPAPHPRSREGLTTVAQRWGITVGLRLVEAFESVRRSE